MKANYPCDLHTHTKRSDGNDTYEELLNAAKARGLQVIAITDHDVAPLDYVETANGRVSLTEAAAERGLTVIPGIEVSCNTQVEDVHIVGLDCDFSDPYFSELKKRDEQSKINSYRKLCEVLTEHGYPVSWEEVLDNNGSPILETQVQKKMIFELMARKGYAPDWSKAKLMVKNTPEFSIKREKPDPCEVIAGIRRTGGFPILAHPFLIDEPVEEDGQQITREEYIQLLVKAGLGGIEACYPYQKTSYKGSQSDEEIESYVRGLFKDTDLFISGGSDYHDDAKKGIKNPRNIGDSGCSVENLLAHPVMAKIYQKYKPQT